MSKDLQALDTDYDAYQGITSNNMYYWNTPFGDAYVGDYDQSEAIPVETPKPKCECGQSSVVRKEEDSPELHSSWCEVYKNEK